jgi:ubiquitin C-terminal hydrolase
VHYGSTVFVGHYIAFIKHGDAWVVYDDDKVRGKLLGNILRQ